MRGRRQVVSKTMAVKYTVKLAGLVVASFAAASAAWAGDIPDGPATKATPPLGKETDSSLDFQRDKDWYRFQVKKG